ncbi:DNA polymerase [candidate division KSB3 bacterium]|uniref:Type-4 uracil-DNA glycosylase n=1 Tax=candidate division KSB3 bacterium TaxID=2044937 RepID=A0A2G6KDW7_9BACT|nr:MAG: DNA polymerase [candidate division KSB3 bacterium]
MHYHTLQQIDDAIRVCTSCQLHATRNTPVPGAGNPQADIFFIGEGPGAKEDEHGLPFIGRSGELLTQLLQEAGLTRKEVFITSLVKCRPPKNRNPLQPEITACHPFLKAQLHVIQPKIICTLGSSAATTLLGIKKPLSTIRGKWFDYEGIKLLPAFHPAYLLRSRSKIPVFQEDLEKLMKAQ